MKLTTNHLSVNRLMARILGGLLLLTAAMANADYSNQSTYQGDRAYDQAMLAPDGKHFAITAQIEGKAGLMVFNIKSRQAVAAFNVDSNQDILHFWWANSERVVINLQIKGATVDYPLLTGELFALNIDNTKKFAIAGFAAGDSADYQFLDALSGNPKLIRVIRSDIKNKKLDLTRPTAYTLNIYKRVRMSTGTNMKSKRLENKFSSPYPGGGFVADNAGELRLAYEVDRDKNLKVSRRDYDIEDWVEIADFAAPMAASSHSKSNPVVGFDARNEGIFYLGESVHNTTGLYYLGIESAAVKTIYEHEQINIRREDLIYASDGDVVGLNLQGTSTAQFFSDHPEVARLQGLVNAFKGNRVDIVNYSSKGEFALIDVHSEGSESGLYLFDSRNNTLSILMPAS